MYLQLTKAFTILFVAIQEDSTIAYSRDRSCEATQMSAVTVQSGRALQQRAELHISLRVPQGIAVSQIVRTPEKMVGSMLELSAPV
jgi:hypothetical protein